MWAVHPTTHINQCTNQGDMWLEKPMGPTKSLLHAATGAAGGSVVHWVGISTVIGAFVGCIVGFGLGVYAYTC